MRLTTDGVNARQAAQKRRTRPAPRKRSRKAAQETQTTPNEVTTDTAEADEAPGTTDSEKE